MDKEIILIDSSIDGYKELDFSFLKEIEPYGGDRRINIAEYDIKREIEDLCAEINAIDIRSIPFDKWNYIMTFAVGLLEVACDFFISDHNNKNSLAHKMSNKNSELGRYFNDIHKKLDHSGQPLDYQGYKFGGGDHRSRTFGHDLIMFPLAIYMLCSRKFIDGYYEDGVFQFIVTHLNQYGNEYAALSFDEALIAYFTHMVADFFSAKSLPIPGFSLLTHFPNRDIRKFANDLYKDGLNLRNLALQGVPVAVAELLLWMYNSLRYRNSTYSKEAIKNKKEKLLLISHGIALSVNAGKVIITKNPTSLNLVMVVRVVKLVWNLIKHELDTTNKAIEKVSLSTLKNQLETMDTLILLDESIYYTREIDRVIANMKSEFDKTNQIRNDRLNEEYNQLDKMMTELMELNS